MGERTGRFGRLDRLRSSRDYRRLSRSGSRRAASSEFVLLVAPSRTLPSLPPSEPPSEPPNDPPAPSRRRLGITASRKVGNAVTRNRIKRCVREWFRHHRDELEEGVDVVVIARPAAATLSSGEVASSLSSLARELAKRRRQRRTARTR